ncbi:MAG: DUF1573 domain-containing protein [Planctomycetes bacterium]|nr:DUF1573 domain-containing protein [Planctomycetota bacterium]
MRYISVISIVIVSGLMVILSSGCKNAQTASVAPLNAETVPKEIAPLKVETTTPPPARLQTVQAAPRHADGGQLTVDKKFIDFGKVEPLSKFSGVFTLTNSGKDDLTITSLSKSCTCTLGKLKVPVTLKPGESVPLEVNFTTPSQPKKVLQTVTVNTRAPAQPARLVVSVTAEVKRLVQAVPEQLEFRLRGEAVADQEIVIECTDERNFSINNYTASGGSFKLDYDGQANFTRHPVKVSDIDYARLKQIPFGYLIVKVSHPKISEINIPYRAIMPYTAFPPTGRFYNLVAGEPQTVALKVVSNFDEEFELGSIRADKGLVKVKSTDKTTDGYRILVELTVPAGSKKIVYRDRLSIKIADHPDDTLTIDCYGYLKPTGK